MKQETTYQVHFGKTYYYKEREEVLEGKKPPDLNYHRIRQFNSYPKAQEFHKKICDRFLDRHEDMFKGVTFCYLIES